MNLKDLKVHKVLDRRADACVDKSLKDCALGGQEVTEHLVLLELAHEFTAHLGAQVVAGRNACRARGLSWFGFRVQG